MENKSVFEFYYRQLINFFGPKEINISKTINKILKNDPKLTSIEIIITNKHNDNLVQKNNLVINLLDDHSDYPINNNENENKEVESLLSGKTRKKYNLRSLTIQNCDGCVGDKSRIFFGDNTDNIDFLDGLDELICDDHSFLRLLHNNKLFPNLTKLHLIHTSKFIFNGNKINLDLVCPNLTTFNYSNKTSQTEIVPTIARFPSNIEYLNIYLKFMEYNDSKNPPTIDFSNYSKLKKLECSYDYAETIYCYKIVPPINLDKLDVNGTINVDFNENSTIKEYVANTLELYDVTMLYKKNLTFEKITVIVMKGPHGMETIMGRLNLKNLVFKNDIIKKYIYTKSTSLTNAYQLTTENYFESYYYKIESVSDIHIGEVLKLKKYIEIKNFIEKNSYVFGQFKCIE